MIKMKECKEIDKRKKYIIGIDEAGRGPVLGPMVYACMYCEEAYPLKSLGVDDSKVLSSEVREQLYGAILKNDSLGFICNVISAKELSGKMLRFQRVNLNAISHSAAAELIRSVLARGVPLAKVF